MTENTMSDGAAGAIWIVHDCVRIIASGESFGDAWANALRVHDEDFDWSFAEVEPADVGVELLPAWGYRTNAEGVRTACHPRFADESGVEGERRLALAAISCDEMDYGVGGSDSHYATAA